MADFTEDESLLYPRLSKELDGMDIGTLVNNAGQCYSHPEYFLNFKEDDPTFRNLIRCNVVSIVNMCRIVMPGMVKKRRGVIMNIGSLSSPCPSPLLTVYGSTKVHNPSRNFCIVAALTTDAVLRQYWNLTVSKPEQARALHGSV